MKEAMDQFDVIVIGAGHAGCEAALAASRMGTKTLLLTINLDHIAYMSCNPAIGGLGKGHLVKEIDALDGEMGRNIDATGIQFKVLNTKKGPAVRSSRAQADKMKYALRIKKRLEEQENLLIRQGTVERLLVDEGAVTGVETTWGERFLTKTVIITAGTFLKGLIHVGLEQFEAGRMGDFSTSLALKSGASRQGPARGSTGGQLIFQSLNPRRATIRQDPFPL
jgi:tRNA uridine 5-carboxymethylaminomethyl modification enzyme